MPNPNASFSVAELEKMLDRAARSAPHKFAITFLNAELQVMREIRSIERAEFQNWMDKLHQTGSQIQQLVNFLRDHDLESEEQATIGANRATVVEEAANCADILLRRCNLIHAHTRPIVAVGEFNSVMGDCLQGVHSIRDSIRKLAADEIHVIYT